MSTRNGIATNVWAITTAAVLNGSWTPNQLSSQRPNRPRRPNEKKSATPATTGGITMLSVHRARTARRPGKWTLARSQARGTPNTSDRIAAITEVFSDSHSAWRVPSDERTSQNRLHGTRHRMPAKGRAKKTMATPASTSAAAGGRCERSRRAPTTPLTVHDLLCRSVQRRQGEDGQVQGGHSRWFQGRGVAQLSLAAGVRGTRTC